MAGKAGALIDFGYVRILSFGLAVGRRIPQDTPDIRKVMIIRDITNEYTSIFYIYSSDGTVYSSQPIRYDEAMNLFEVIDNVSLVSRKYSSLAAGKCQGKMMSPTYSMLWRSIGGTMNCPCCLL